MKMSPHAFLKQGKTGCASRRIFRALFVLLPSVSHAQSTTSSSILKVNTPLTTAFYQKAPDPRLYDRFNAAGDWTHLGAFRVEQSATSPMVFEQGTTVTLAYPVNSVPGLDLVINTFGGHRQTSTGSRAGSAAVTAGVRLKW